ncbi:uncharacterized protein TNCV_88021 [Trichonephila clavipes]|nr:uncharacterized protein TNCV_88021 [Trichonephila clavipes]
MEVDGALSIFQRSVQRYDVRYTKYLGDGDSKAFDNIVKNEVYGDNCTITKLECIGHVIKRMGSRLRRFKAKMRGQKLSDGKALCQCFSNCGARPPGGRDNPSRGARAS